jgi:ABC-type transport system substrate-binding protein
MAVRPLIKCVFISLLLLTGCKDGQWNNPYRSQDTQADIIYTSFQERPKELDPVKSYNAAEYEFIAQIYEPPLQYHFLKRPYELVPLSARRLPIKTFYDQAGEALPADVDPAQVAYTDYVVEIQSGIRYQPHPSLAENDTGEYRYHQLQASDLDDVYVLSDFEYQGSRTLTAHDYVYQIKRLAHPNLHSPLAGLLGNYIVGFSDYREKVLSALEAEPDSWLDLTDITMEGVTAIDEYRYRIRVRGVYPQFIYWLSMPFFSPIPWEADKFYAQPGMKQRNLSFDWYPIGTGPFMLTENNPNLRMVLEKNPNFHGETYPTEGEQQDYSNGLLDDAGRAMPFVDKVIFSLEKESIPYWNKFMQGFYDTSGISSDSFDQSVELNSQGQFALTDEMREKGIELSSAVATSLYYLGFNMRDPIVGGLSERARLLRRAISIAVDYDEFISIFRNGRGVPAQGPIPPGIFGYEEGEAGHNPYIYDWDQQQLKRRSIKAAKAMMREAGYAQGVDQETGKPLILYFDTVSRGADTKALLNWMVKQFAKIDIQLVIRGTDGNRFFDKLNQGTFQIYQLGWNADYPDPENFFFLLYGPNSILVSKGQNYSNYENAEFDALFDQMKNMENSPQRLQIIRDMNDIVRADAPWVFAFNPKSYSLTHRWYENVKPNLMANNTMKYKRIDAQTREQMRQAWNPPLMWPLYVLMTLFVIAIIPAIRGYQKREQARGL